MAMLEVKYVHEFKDRHGKTRWYFRRRGFKQAPLRGPFASDEFWVDYNTALRQPRIGTPSGAGQVVPGTVDDLVVRYYQSAKFKRLSTAAANNYRRNIDHFRNAVIKGLRLGSLPTAGLRRTHLLVYFDTMADKPGKTYTAMKRLKTLFDFAREREIMRENPADRLEKPTLKGFRSLEEDDINKFLKYWAPGTTQHLAMLLLLYTGQRRSDVVRMVRTHIKNGRIAVLQQKTGKFLEIPIHPVLQAAIDRIPDDQLVILQSSNKRAFSGASFGNMFRQWCRAAGLPENSSPHGCRKAAGRMLAEAGCTAREIMAVLGHESLAEAERYTRAADQIHLADAAMSKIARERTEEK